MIRMDSPGGTLQRRYWSFSKLNQYLRCPLQFYFQRILKLPQPTIGSGLVYGSAVHNGLAYIHQQMMNSMEVDLKILKKEFCDTWGDYEQTKICYKANESKEVLIEKGLSTLQLYLSSPVRSKIVGVEQSVVVPLMNSQGEYIESPMMAIIDLVTSTDGRMTIHEFKTSARQYSQLEVELSMQATTYANAVNETYQQNPAIEFVVFTKTKTPKVQRIQTARNQSDLQQLGDLVEKVEQAVDDNCFYPNRSPMNCSWCPYREPCKKWKVPTSSLVTLNGVGQCSSN